MLGQEFWFEGNEKRIMCHRFLLVFLKYFQRIDSILCYKPIMMLLLCDLPNFQDILIISDLYNFHDFIKFQYSLKMIRRNLTLDNK
jgi:hypothetical protein